MLVHQSERVQPNKIGSFYRILILIFVSECDETKLSRPGKNHNGKQFCSLFNAGFSRALINQFHPVDQHNLPLLWLDEGLNIFKHPDLK